MLGIDSSRLWSSVKSLLLVLNWMAIGCASTVTVSASAGDFHRDVDGDVAARLHEHVALHDGGEAAELCRQRVSAGIDVVEQVAAVRALSCA